MSREEVLRELDAHVDRQARRLDALDNVVQLLEEAKRIHDRHLEMETPPSPESQNRLKGLIDTSLLLVEGIRRS